MRRHASIVLLFAAAVLSLSIGNSACTGRRGQASAANAQPADTAMADLVYIDDFHDFGTIQSGEVVTFAFRFRNNGTAPLIIKDIIPDCGCTSTRIDKHLYAPHEQGYIEVQFNSKGWHGSQYKQVTLRTNSPIRDKSVTIKANVI